MIKNSSRLLLMTKPKLVLDLISEKAAVAYSLRRLYTSWTGSAIQVRRSIDDALLNIGFNSNGTLDLNNLSAFVGYQNLVRNSNNFANNTWSKRASVITSNIETQKNITFSKITETNLNDQHSIFLNLPTPTVPRPVTVSVFAKKTTERSFVWLQIGGKTVGSTSNDNFPAAIFNLATGTVSSTVNEDSNNKLRARIQLIGNDVYRCSVTGTLATLSIACGVTNSPFGIVYTGEEGSGILISSLQVNEGELQLYQETSSNTANGNGFIATWYDQSGNNNSLTQSNLLNQPFIVKNGVVNRVNNNPAALFDGVNSFMNTNTSGPSFLGGASVVLNALDNSTFSNSRSIFSRVANDIGTYNSWTANSGATTINSLITSSEATPEPPIINYIQTNQFSPLSRLKVVVTNSLSSQETSGWSLGQNRGLANSCWNGNISELIAFSSVLSNNDLQTLQRDQGKYYNLGLLN